MPGETILGFLWVSECVVDRRDAHLAVAVKVLQEIQSLCEVNLQALAVGEPVLLIAQKMAEVLRKFSSYGRKAASAAQAGPQAASAVDFRFSARSKAVLAPRTL